MERYGIIREELELKGFLLFVLRQFPDGIDFDSLLDIVIDRISDYFDLMTALSDLVGSEHISLDTDQSVQCYRITEKGLRDEEIIRPNVPYSIRLRTQEDIDRHLVAMRRNAAIKTSSAADGDAFMTTLQLSADHGTIMELSLRFSNESDATAAERSFRKNAELLYNTAIKILLDDSKHK